MVQNIDQRILSLIADYLQRKGFKKAGKKLVKQMKKSMDLIITENSSEKLEDFITIPPPTEEQSVVDDINEESISVNQKTEEQNTPQTSKITTKNQEEISRETERFKRVREEEVEFIDERLKDNSYLAKPAALNTYGFKAYQDLSVTKGKGFLKAKNKKKRGSYRGGFIDTGSHSIKFQD